MFYLRKKYVSKILDAIELQRHLRRWLAENEASRRREEKERKRKARLKIENAAMTIVQSTARVWLAKRIADRKREVMDNAQDDLDTAETRYDEISQQGLWPTSSHYTEYALMLMFDAAEWNEAEEYFDTDWAGAKDPQLLFATLYSAHCAEAVPIMIWKRLTSEKRKLWRKMSLEKLQEDWKYYFGS